MASKKQKFSFSLFFLLLFLATLAAILVFSTSIKKFSRDNQSPQAGCSVPNFTSLSGEFDYQDTKATWLGEETLALNQEFPLSQEAQSLAKSAVLGETSGEKWIEINLTNQRLITHQGDNIIYQFPISSGKFAPTPIGEYEIWYKIKYTKMAGGVKGSNSYYYLPNVPYVVYFYKDYGINGTYWHNNFGTPMSHGCVNLSTSDAEKLFYWTNPFLPSGASAVLASEANPGTKVIIHGTTPKN